jgi:hypothetical protein
MQGNNPVQNNGVDKERELEEASERAMKCVTKSQQLNSTEGTYSSSKKPRAVEEIAARRSSPGPFLQYNTTPLESKDANPGCLAVCKSSRPGPEAVHLSAHLHTRKLENCVLHRKITSHHSEQFRGC